jgi:hypothetical protein
VRYLFHLMLSVMDPSLELKNRVMDHSAAIARQKKLTGTEIAERRARLEAVVAKLVQASVEVLSEKEMQAYDGSVGLDATPVPLYSRGPSKRAGTSASDPDGAWYVRDGDHREVDGTNGKKIRKIHWALEATIAVMGRPPGSVPSLPEPRRGHRLGPPRLRPGWHGHPTP